MSDSTKNQGKKGGSDSAGHDDHPAIDTAGGIAAVRLYRQDQPGDGYRVLVDRIWPRGVAKADLDHDEWGKDVAPSDELRRRFHGGDLTFHNFSQAYEKELRESNAPQELLERFESSKGDLLVLLYAAKDEEENHALVLADFLRDIRKNG